MSVAEKSEKNDGLKSPSLLFYCLKHKNTAPKLSLFRLAKKEAYISVFKSFSATSSQNQTGKS